MQKSVKKHRKPPGLFHRFSSLSTISRPAQLCLYCIWKAKNNCVEIPKLVGSCGQCRNTGVWHKTMRNHKEEKSLAQQRQDKHDTANQKWLWQLNDFESWFLPWQWRTIQKQRKKKKKRKKIKNKTKNLSFLYQPDKKVPREKASCQLYSPI